jgi:hypothetical protein
MLSNSETTKRRFAGRGEDVQRSKANLRARTNSEPVIDPALERPLLKLHRALDVIRSGGLRDRCSRSQCRTA